MKKQEVPQQTILSNKKKFIKLFARKNLLCSDNELEKRVLKIEIVSSIFDFIPNTKFILSDNDLMYIQEFVIRSFPEHTRRLDLLEELSNNLDVLSQYDFVHGDINSSNVIYDGDKLMLVDLEPSFLQLKHGKKVLKCSAPKRSQNDITNKTISIETDKLGFFLFCYKFLNITYFIKITEREVLQRRKKGIYNFLPINESDFIKLSFNEIFQLFKLELSNL
jgi:hypothetical protein